MKKRILAALLAVMLFMPCLHAAALGEEEPLRTITDMAGRTVTLPGEIHTVFSSGPVAAIYLYTLAPEKLLGWNYALTENEKAFILPAYHDLPSFGVNAAINYEAVMLAGPTIALSVGQVNERMVEDADKLSLTLGIPVVCINEDLAATAEAYRLLGEVLGAEERAEQLALYAEETLGAIAAIDVPAEQRPTMYYGNGEDSLETAPSGSSHSQMIEMVGAVNAAKLELGDGHRMQISPEQLLVWDPDVIVVTGETKAGLSAGAAAEKLKSNPVFAALSAVMEDRVYAAPTLPFGWLDRPPGPNRLIGLRWLSGVLYPQLYEQPVDAEIRAFFRLFYHMELTDEQLAVLMN